MKQLTLREARTRAGLTQVELAEASGVLQTTISKLETSEASDPNFSTVIRLSKALRVRPDELNFGTRGQAIA